MILVSERGRFASLVLAIVCFLVWTGTSCARWADFAYRTFDLAYYVQALWQLIHGRAAVSVENVPLLGNHVEPIVFLFAPLFFVFRHPMLFVVVQNAALASMGPVAYSLARRLGFDPRRAFLLAAALLLTPATGFIALHEFHPEALAAPFLLLLLHAWVSGSRARHWVWFLATLACKENMALLLVAYCAVQCLAERRRGFAELRGWFIWPMLAAAGWFLLCATVITPAFNSGSIDYGALYDRLGNSPRAIILNAFVRPGLIWHALGHSLKQGNLLWALLVPFLGLPLLRPRWLLISAPILLQHLLSWRSSEWTIYFHYAAPLLPLFWIAAAQALAPGSWTSARVSHVLGGLMLAACFAGQIFLGPMNGIAATAHDWFTGKTERARKNQFLAAIPADASVVAPLPYLSHLAMRERLYSLHYILKGLKTLSRATFEPPPPTDFSLIDYADRATFDATAGYYHPTMRTADGRVIPSSDQLLHAFLARASWQARSANELTLLRRADVKPSAAGESPRALAELGPHTQLLQIAKSRDAIHTGERFEITTRWRFENAREIFPWLELRLVRPGQAPVIFLRGLCAPQIVAGAVDDLWEITETSQLTPGNYEVVAIFSDRPRQIWSEKSGQSLAFSGLLAPPIPIGTLRVLPASAGPG
ncbi:MAG: DUF2079 domain-containing protein [Chthoniobacterales bacterium]